MAALLFAGASALSPSALAMHSSEFGKATVRSLKDADSAEAVLGVAFSLWDACLEMM